MEFFNPFGLIFIMLIMIPNIVFALKCKEGFENHWKSKVAKILEICEQIGRYGCFGFMIFNVPGTCFGFSSDFAFVIYLIVNSILIFAYCLIWIICFRKNTLFRAIALSVIPSVIFLLSGFLSRHLLLIIFAVIFAPSHIGISVENQIKTQNLSSLDFAIILL